MTAVRESTASLASQEKLAICAKSIRDMHDLAMQQENVARGSGACYSKLKLIQLLLKKYKGGVVFL